MALTTERKILIGRFLSRSGDQAWDFSVPLVLLHLMPGQLRVAALYYLIVRLIHVVLLPKFAALIDRMNRHKAVRMGLVTQAVGVLLSAVAIFMLQPYAVFPFTLLVLAGVVGGLGASFMDIAIANDLVPAVVPNQSLSKFNSRLRQFDLTTEVTAPVVAGLLLQLTSPAVPLLGFVLIVAWNLVSFVPEYLLLTSVFKTHPALSEKVIEPAPSAKLSLLQKLTLGWRSFFKEPVAPAVIAYALLWLSVLSPHGILLTAFLKDGWKLPEWAIGGFRGLGAVFGLVATFLFPWVVKKAGLLRAGQSFLIFQCAMVLAALFCFLSGSSSAQIAFLIFILLSRIGLYGFSLGEMQIRQLGVPEQTRGRVNGFASALTAIITLALYGAGALLPSTDSFYLLVEMSVLAVVTGTILYSVWLNWTKPVFKEL